MDIDGMQSQEEGVGESELARKKRMGKKHGGEGRASFARCAKEETESEEEEEASVPISSPIRKVGLHHPHISGQQNRQL